MDEAERIEESTDDITAADRAPRPTMATSGDVRCRSTSGRIIAASAASTPSAPQSAARPMTPIKIAGTAAARLRPPAQSDNRRASAGLFVASTRWK